MNGTTRRIVPGQHKRIIEMLDILEAATSPRDLNGVRNFHGMKGDRKGTFAMHVNGPFCITFKFKDGDIIDIDYENYHS